MRRKREKRIGFPWRLVPILLILLCFITSVGQLDLGRQEEGRKQLEDALRHTAAACYAAEGSYPPSLEYMEEHYGIRVDREHYTVIYDVFASNLMPDITVLDYVP